MTSPLRWLLAALLLMLPRAAQGEESEDAFLERVQEAAFRYFWKECHPGNGLIRDRSRPDSKCSIAAVGFGLSALAIGVDHGWISRAEGRERAVRTLETLSGGAQGPEASGVTGHRGWYYHFLEMDTGHRAWKCELSSVDTALLLAGALDAAAYFSGEDAVERRVRELANGMVARVDWEWMANGGATLTMGWHPESGFLKSRWVGYNEAMILVLLALGAPETPPAGLSWEAWTRDYRWETHQGYSYVAFAPLFGHQYSHCWVDFRGKADALMRSRGLSYFENSRRATLAQRAYCMERSTRFPNYGPWEWGITACDGPDGYAARGAPPAENDDGTLAPTAVGGSVPFAPEICIRTLRELERRHAPRLWGPYGFRDAFNRDRDWWATDTLGIDQGPILLMIENHRSGAVWRRMAGSAVLRRGLDRAGFRALPEGRAP